VPPLLDEIEVNFDEFRHQWEGELSGVLSELAKKRKNYLSSYTRLTSLNSWREELVSQVVSPDSLAFFLEAQNDALISHVFASMGSWRSALKSLRGCIENTLHCLYFKDHPVELQLWSVGRFRLAFSELCDYFLHHPQFDAVPPHLSGLDLVRKEYGVLSRAVHGSTHSE
jgi:hypothetical protein